MQSTSRRAAADGYCARPARAGQTPVPQFSPQYGSLDEYSALTGNSIDSFGETGEEPPEDIKALWELGERYLQAQYGSEEYYALGNEFYDTHFEAMYMIGTIQRPPQPLLFASNLRNTPPSDTEGLWSWSYRQWVMFMPEQWYFE